MALLSKTGGRKKVQQKSHEGVDRKVWTGRCGQEGAGRKVRAGRCGQEGAGRKVRAGRCGQEGAGRKVRAGRCGQEGAGRKVRAGRCGQEGAGMNRKKLGTREIVDKNNVVEKKELNEVVIEGSWGSVDKRKSRKKKGHEKREGGKTVQVLLEKKKFYRRVG